MQHIPDNSAEVFNVEFNIAVFSRRGRAEELTVVENAEATTASLRSRKAPRFAQGGL